MEIIAFIIAVITLMPILTAFVAWVISNAVQRQKKRFFCFGDSKSVTVYLSNIRQLGIGTRGIDDVTRTFNEASVPVTEMELASLYRLFLVSASSRLRMKNLLLSDVHIGLEPSPLDITTVEKMKTIISMGSPGYNKASEYIENELHSLGRFVDQNTAIEMSGTPPYDNPLYSYVQRAINTDTGQVAYYVAGITSRGTQGAAFYLLDKWRDLQKKYEDDRPFCVVLKISGEDFKRSEIVASRP